MSMAQQTAVMQLIKFILVERRQEDGSIKFHAHEDFSRFLQMEKEQIEKAWWAGHDERDANHMIYPSEDCNQYYNGTYGKPNSTP